MDIGLAKETELIDKFMGLDNSEKNYKTSWDALMPVVEKIEENEEIDVNILLNGTVIFKWRTQEDIVNNVANISFDNKIEHTYDAVIEYLKIINKQEASV